MTTAKDVRDQLVAALRLDLIGPDNDSPLAREGLPQAPSRWYLTGFLVPLDAGEKQRKDEESAEEVGEIEEAAVADDAVPSEPRAAKSAWLPSSMGLSFLAAAAAREASVRVSWGDYRPVPRPRPAGDETTSGGGGARRWQREPREAAVKVVLPASTEEPIEVDVPDSGGLRLSVVVRPVIAPALDGALPPGTRSVSVFLVNRRTPVDDPDRDAGFAFQTRLEVELGVPFVARPDLHGLTSDDHDERVADLQYRDSFEFAVGHAVATDTACGPDGQCRTVRTAWIPAAEVERVEAAEVPGVELKMEALADLASGDEASRALAALPKLYREWLEAQRRLAPAAPPKRAETADLLLRRAAVAARRIEEGIASLAEPDTLAAFQLANRTVATALRRRRAAAERIAPTAVAAPAWRPFQLAFILMNLPALAGATHPDRAVVDLLFFPTGGGKTEAYLGLAAFTLVHRRLKHPGLASAGVAVLMRYTLRLLTLDQLGRAATLICALELEREKDPERLGPWPFEIGLWVGRGATPNRMGDVKDKGRETARARTIAYKNDDRKPSPIPLQDCPWCGTRFNRNSFNLVPRPDRPLDLRITCVSRDCDFHGGRSLVAQSRLLGKVKHAELEVLTAPGERLGEDRPGTTFFAEALPRERWDLPVMAPFERVLLVHRLREVTAAVGFTRFEPTAPDVDGELEIGARRASLSREADWLPAVENRGEGIFLGFAKAAIAEWLLEPGVQARGRKLEAGFARWQKEHHGSKRKFAGLPYVFLHSLAHLLITEVALVCGYPASSIRERIYAGEGGYGILLFTASPDAEGTLGGLIEVGRDIARYVALALAERGRLCSNDPVCAEHDPASAHEQRYLLGAACHGCLLIAEPSCERQNDDLDRALVVPTVGDSAAAFFAGERAVR